MGTLFRPLLVLRDHIALFPTLRYFLGRSGSAIVIAGRCDRAIIITRFRQLQFKFVGHSTLVRDSKKKRSLKGTFPHANNNVNWMGRKQF